VLSVVKFVRREIIEIVHYLPYKKDKISAACQTVAAARIVSKMCQGQPPTFGSHCSRFHPNWFTFDRVIAERISTVLWQGITCKMQIFLLQGYVTPHGG